MSARDPRDVENARRGADPRVRALVQTMLGGCDVDLSDEHPNVLRHVALALSLLAAMRMVASAPTDADRCSWRIEAETLTFAAHHDADWLDTHAARLVATGTVEASQRGSWYDLWELTPPHLLVPVVMALASLLHTPLRTVQRPM